MLAVVLHRRERKEQRVRPALPFPGDQSLAFLRKEPGPSFEQHLDRFRVRGSRRKALLESDEGPRFVFTDIERKRRLFQTKRTGVPVVRDRQEPLLLLLCAPLRKLRIIRGRQVFQVTASERFDISMQRARPLALSIERK